MVGIVRLLGTALPILQWDEMLGHHKRDPKCLKGGVDRMNQRRGGV